MIGAAVYTESDIKHREAFEAFVLNDAQAWHREHLGRLYKLWQTWNQMFFRQQIFRHLMVPPYIVFAAPSSTRALGDCSPISGFGGRLQIRIRESLLTGHHSYLRKGDRFAEGRFKFVADVLLHEMLHQYQIEIARRPEKSYKGHGPLFRDLSNEIGAELGLPPVRVAKARGKNKDMPSCAYWPHCVRPASYYEGALAVEYSTEQSRFVRPISNINGGDRLAEAVAMLAKAAEGYAKAWPVGTDKEAPLILAGNYTSRAVLEKLEVLCIAARGFSDVALLDWEDKGEK